jgi:hypothetical protein
VYSDVPSGKSKGFPMSVPYVLHMFEALYPQQQSKKECRFVLKMHTCQQ